MTTDHFLIALLVLAALEILRNVVCAIREARLERALRERAEMRRALARISADGLPW